MSAHTPPMSVTLEQTFRGGKILCKFFTAGRHVANLNLSLPEAEEFQRVIRSHAALLAAAEGALRDIIDKLDGHVCFDGSAGGCEFCRAEDALRAAVAAAKGEA